VSGYILAGLRHRPGRALGALLGVALGVALFIALTAAGDGFREAARRPLANVGADILITRPVTTTQAAAEGRGIRLPFGLAPMTLGEIDTLRGVPGVSTASGGLLLWDFGPQSYQTVLGVDASATGAGPARAQAWLIAGRFFSAGERGVAVADRHYAAFFKLTPGSTVRVGEQSFQVVGIVEVPGGNQAAAANLYLPLADAQALAGLTHDQVDQAYVRVREATSAEAVVAESRARLGPVQALTEDSIVQVMGGITQVSDRFAGVAALAALVGGLALTGLALSGNVAMRAREIGVMKAVGWPARLVTRTFLLEGLALSVLGALLGVALGALAVAALAQWPLDVSALFAATTPDMPGMPGASVVGENMTLPAQLNAGMIMLALVVSVAGGGLASFLAAWRAARMKPAAALRDAS
jgi:putative ABC transport system permease protein